MQQRHVGSSGLQVSEVGLGTLTWGRDTTEDEAAGQLQAFLDAGGTLVDTSPAFGGGAAETTVGHLLDGAFDRADLVLCARTGYHGASPASGRSAILDGLDATLMRLGTDHVDLLVLAGPDPVATDEETALALASVAASGRARYIGISGYPAWRAAAVATLLKERRVEPLRAVVTEYSLLERSPERDLLPLAAHLGMGVLATSALGRGVLTGKYRHSIPPTSRAASEHLAAFVDPYLTEPARRIVEAVVRAADGLGRSAADVALGWLLSTTISSAVVGARTAAQLAATLETVDTLPQIVMEALSDASVSAL